MKSHGVQSRKSLLSIRKILERAIDYRPHSEAILRRIGSPVADQVAGILQWVIAKS